MAAPKQAGFTLIAKPAPTFANFVVVDGTWRERDSLAVEATKDGNSETYNYAGADAGVDAQCEVVLKTGATALKKLDVLSSTEATPRHFVVTDVETMNFGGKAQKQSLTLEFRESLQEELAP